jgi:hypothetical protein
MHRTVLFPPLATYQAHLGAPHRMHRTVLFPSLATYLAHLGAPHRMHRTVLIFRQDFALEECR